jgi:hypothetical protein
VVIITSVHFILFFSLFEAACHHLVPAAAAAAATKAMVQTMSSPLVHMQAWHVG